MSHILIDGYNLIGISHESLEKARSDLIQRLLTYTKIKGHSVTVVFDGWKDGQKDEKKTRSGNVTVIYSRIGETADHVIKRVIQSSDKPWIVVSSDRDVAHSAITREIAAVSSAEFDNILHFTLHDKKGYFHKKEGDDDPDVKNLDQKGNPKRRSKRDRIIAQALRKL